MKFYFFAKTQHENMGDRGIAFSAMTLLRNYGDVIVNVKGCPADYVGQIENQGVIVSNDSGIVQICRIISEKISGNKVALIMKPGHFFGNDGGIFARISQLLSLAVFRLFGVGIYRFGASIGPYKKNIARLELISSKLYTKYTARENFSIDYCRSIGINNVEYFPDLAFVLPENFHGRHNSIKEKNKLFDCVFSFRRPDLGEADYFELVQYISEKSGGLSCCVTQVARDELFNKILMEKCLGVNGDHIAYGKNTAEEIFDLYSNTKVIFSNRLHVLLFAGIKGALPIPIVSGRENKKIIGIYNAMGMSEIVIDIDLGIDLAINNIERINSNYSEIVKKFHIKFNESAQIIKLHMQKEFAEKN